MNIARFKPLNNLSCSFDILWPIKNKVHFMFCQKLIFQTKYRLPSVFVVFHFLDFTQVTDLKSGFKFADDPGKKKKVLNLFTDQNYSVK